VSSCDEPAIACTLAPADAEARVDEWAAVLGHVLTRTPIAGGRRLEFDGTIDPGELATLVVAEQRCCAFFSFAITADARGLGLEVSAPAAAADLVTAVFGPAPVEEAR
jgi:hypothetical protein